MFKRIMDFFFIYVLLEGALRKWVAPDLSLEIQIVRDVLPGLALVAFVLENRRVSEFGQIGGVQALLLGAYIACTFASLLIFLLASNLPLFVAAVGFRTHLAYLPLAFLMPAYLGSWPAGIRKIKQLLALGAAVFLFGFFQFTQPIDSVWNRYSDAEARVAGFASLQSARVTGTFSYISGFGQLAQTCGSLSFLLLLLRRRGPRELLFPGSVLVLSVGAIMASGSRGPLAILFASCVALLGMGVLIGVVRKRRAVAALVALALLSSIGLLFLQDQLQAFLFRVGAVGTSDVGWRLRDYFLQWFDVMLEHPLGVGIGTGHQALMDVVATETPNLYEVELSRIAFELGVGVLVYLGAKLALIGQIFSAARTASNRDGRILLIGCGMALLPLVVTGSVFTPVSNIAFWSISGIAFWVLKLEKPAKAARWRATALQMRHASHRTSVGQILPS